MRSYKQKVFDILVTFATVTSKLTAASRTLAWALRSLRVRPPSLSETSESLVSHASPAGADM